jgi:hypothetical protein
MLRTTVDVDSATPRQVYNLTLAFQRTLGFELPRQITTRPTVTVGGSAMGWRSPALRSDHAQALLAEYHALEAEDAGRALAAEARP